MSTVQSPATITPASILSDQSQPVTTEGYIFRALVYMDKNALPAVFDFPVQHNIFSFWSNPVFLERSGFPLVQYKIFDRAIGGFVGVHSRSIYDVSRVRWDTPYPYFLIKRDFLNDADCPQIQKYMRELGGGFFDALKSILGPEDSALSPSTPPPPPSSPLPTTASEKENEKTADKTPLLNIQTLNFNLTVNTHNYERNSESDTHEKVDNRKRAGTPNNTSATKDGSVRKRMRMSNKNSKLDMIGGSIETSGEIIEISDNEKNGTTIKKSRPKSARANSANTGEIIEILDQEFHKVTIPKDKGTLPDEIITQKATVSKGKDTLSGVISTQMVTASKAGDMPSDGINTQTVVLSQVEGAPISDRTNMAQPGPSHLTTT
ncbi:hypothetical protein NP233_g7525 [Leucocoprinus birnbaumii]|uniref:Uncharacterized protein n=1 Tax=Leucocoprinus birnbaumii TaxID=56174 RepID=A0AAD5YNX4_9AGAR|nr:hypothetical protein NP233_g7525 [Leucocoprinus birnbaumii]